MAELREREFGFEEIFIDGNDEEEKAYGLRVPVVLVDGTEVFEAQVDPDLLRQALGPSAVRGD